MRPYRFRNRILQYFYRPYPAQTKIFSAKTLSWMDEMEKAIEEKITPLLSGLFE